MAKDLNKYYSHFNWGPFVAKFTCPKNVLKRLDAEGKQAERSWNHQLAGHIKSQFKYPEEFEQWFYKEMSHIFTAYRQAHCEYHALPYMPTPLLYQSLWVNFMKAGDFNPPHIHGGDISFVIFVDVPKQLEKEMEEHEGTTAKPGQLMFNYGENSKGKQWATIGHHVTPKTGDMYIFPAQQQHWVAPFKSEVTRISVSGNLKVQYPEGTPTKWF